MAELDTILERSLLTSRLHCSMTSQHTSQTLHSTEHIAQRQNISKTSQLDSIESMKYYDFFGVTRSKTSPDRQNLLHDLTISESLTINSSLPSHHVLEELLVLRLANIQRSDGVRVDIGSNLQNGLGVLTAANHNTRDQVVVVLTKDTHGTHGVFAGGLKTGEETTNEVVRLENGLKFVVVLVVQLDDGVSFVVEVLEEPGESLLAGVFVGVSSLPLVKVERGLGQVVQGVLGLGSGLGLVIVVVLGSGSSLGLLSLRSRGSLRLLLLLGGNKLDVVLSKVEVAENLEELGLVGDGLEVSDGVGVLGAEVDTSNAAEDEGKVGSDGQVGKGDTVTDKEGLLLELGLEEGESAVEVLVALLLSSLVVGEHAEAKEEDLKTVVEDLVVSERNPLVNESSGLGVSAEELGVVREAGNCERVSESERKRAKRNDLERNKQYESQFDDLSTKRVMPNPCFCSAPHSPLA